MEEELLFTPSSFVAVFNQVLDTAFPFVTVEGEVSNFRIAKGKWVYFNIKDDEASVACFCSTFQLHYPIEDGMIVSLRARPQLHPLYNFSLQVSDIAPKGEGSIKKAFDILVAKLTAEGLFDESRKRSLPYPPESVGLVTSSEAAAYGDFTKVTAARWSHVELRLADVHVQGPSAAPEIVDAIRKLNEQADPVEVIVIVRGGGSADDLVAFQDEQLTRAIAASRIPTIVAIGHERDVSLAELAADQRASTPSNAAEFLFPSQAEEQVALDGTLGGIKGQLRSSVDLALLGFRQTTIALQVQLQNLIKSEQSALHQASQLLEAYNPTTALKRGYSLIRMNGKIIKSVKSIKVGDTAEVQLSDGQAGISITSIKNSKVG